MTSLTQRQSFALRIGVRVFSVAVVLAMGVLNARAQTAPPRAPAPPAASAVPVERPPVVVEPDRTLTRPSTSAGGRRLALVVGNNRYVSAPLQNAAADARSVATALRDVGFGVTLIEDTSRTNLVSAVSNLEAALGPDDTAVFFFAGHGMQQGGENYLIPTDYVTTSGTSARLSALATTDVQQALAKAKVSILILDACRNNPFTGQRGSQGLAPMEGRGSLIAYATGAGQTASDNPSETNGVFTQELLKAFAEPNLGVRDLFFRVRQRVYSSSNGKQFPAVYDGLLGDVVLRPGPVSVPQVSETRAANTNTSAAPGIDPAESALWAAIERSSNAVEYQAYLEKYPNGVFAPLARIRMDAANRSASAQARAASTSDAATASPPQNLAGTNWTGTCGGTYGKNTTWKWSISLSLGKDGEGRLLFEFVGGTIRPVDYSLAGAIPVNWTLVASEVLITRANNANFRMQGRLRGQEIAGQATCGLLGAWSATLIQ